MGKILGEEDRFRLPPMGFSLSETRLEFFFDFELFPAHIRDFKNLKSTWHQMLARSHQLQGIFGLLKPFIHVHILICFVEVYQNHGVSQLYPSQ